MNENELILRDKLAIERTTLANERTFLAYFRSSVFFLATGVSIVQIHFFREVGVLGWGFVGISPVILGVGLLRLYKVRRTIQEMVDKAIT